MTAKIIDDISQITQSSASDSLMEWFDNRVEELFQDDELRKSCLITHAAGRDIAAAKEFNVMEQLEYDCCCNAAWAEAKAKWVKGELS